MSNFAQSSANNKDWDFNNIRMLREEIWRLEKENTELKKRYEELGGKPFSINDDLEFLNKHIIAIPELSTRAKVSLTKKGIYTIADLSKRTIWSLRFIRGIGEGTIKNIIDYLHQNGIELQNGSQQEEREKIRRRIRNYTKTN